MTEVYLDNAATTWALPSVVEAVSRALAHAYGNPSSLHRKGMEAEAILKEARGLLARILDVSAGEIVFTSGGTESNALAIKGTAYARRRRGRHLVTTRIEHSSVLSAFRDLEAEGFSVTYLPVDREGRVDPADVRAAVSDETTLVSVMMVNNEIGTVQPIGAIARAAREKRPDVVVHVDAVQALGVMPVRPKELGVDLVSVSGHKIHGPKGVGALYVRKGLQIQPLFGKGSQEGGLRSGTENVPGIAGFGAALRALAEETGEERERLRSLRERLITELLEIEGARLNGARGEGAAPHIANFSFPGVRGEVLVHALEERSVYVSTGSACTSRTVAVSHVLKALGLPEEALESSIRISLSKLTTEDEIAFAAAAIKDAVASLRRMLSRR